MTLTKALKGFISEKCGVAADAADDVFRKALGDGVANGTLDIAKVQELSAKSQSDGESKVRGIVADELKNALTNPDVLGAIAKAMGGKVGGDGGSTPTPATGATGGEGLATKAFSTAAGRPDGTGEGDPYAGRIEVKSVVERFAHTPSNLTYDQSPNVFLKSAFGGQQVFSGNPSYGGYALETPTPRTKAIAGAWFKKLVGGAFRQAGMAVPRTWALNEQDQMLIKHAIHECQFVGSLPDQYGGEVYLTGQKLHSDMWRKTLLDDSTSGGLEAVPIEFDAAVILTPVLSGELFPLVDVRNVNRRRIEATAIGNPTVTWGGASGTSISLFNTDSFISAFDNNIHVVDGAMELGNDFLADSPLDVAGIVQDNYGKVFRQQLDHVIATGDGITQPEGLFTASGVATVTPAGGAGTAPQVGDYEGLMHGIAKEYQQEAGLPPNSRMVFIGTQTSYQRARSIPVDSSNDARRIFGQDNQMDYRLMGLRYSINSSLTNAQIGCFCLNRYRMYRRLGFTVQIAANDAQSLRRNTQTIVVRGRFGGSLEKAAAGTKITNAQA